MGTSIKDIPENGWAKLDGNKSYAFRLKSDRDVRLRFGAGGLYIAIVLSSSGDGVVNTIGLENGVYSVVGKLPQQTPILLGRSSDSKIVISNPIVSRKHIELYLEGEILVIKDFGSTNGSYCLVEDFHFDIDAYLVRRPSEKASENTMDEIHEAFGATIDDFLKKYSEKNKKG